MTDPKISEAQSSRAETAAGPSHTAPAHSGFFSQRNLLFLAFLAVSAGLFWGPIRTLIDYSMRGEHKYDQYSITVMIPFLSAAVVFGARKRIFASVQYSFWGGGILLAAGIAADWLARRGAGTMGVEAALSLAILGLVIFWIGGLVLCYGRRAFRAGLFPLLFLLLTVPLPSALLNGPVTFVQHGSADVASAVFAVFGVPVLRSGLVFALPALSIQVAKECSGIHSMLALFVIALLAGYLTGLVLWKRSILVALIFPIVCLTNGLRISALALLSNYLDPRIIHSSLHRDGGFLFFGMAMIVLLGVMYLMGVRRRKPAHSAAAATLPTEK